MAERRVRELVVRRGETVYLVPDIDENGEPVTKYVIDDDAAESREQIIRGFRALAGMFSDLDWDEMEHALEEIRRRNLPTPPIDEP